MALCICNLVDVRVSSFRFFFSSKVHLSLISQKESPSELVKKCSDFLSDVQEFKQCHSSITFKVSSLYF